VSTSMSSFRFDNLHLRVSPGLVAEIPVGISSKEHLLEELSNRLRFPDYFGSNWDALEECIRDLSWLPVGPIVLKHSDLPIPGDVMSQKTYLSILKSAAKEGCAFEGQCIHRLIVVFPSEIRKQIASLVGN